MNGETLAFVLGVLSLSCATLAMVITSLACSPDLERDLGEDLRKAADRSVNWHPAESEEK